MARAARPVILRQLLASVASVALIAGHTGTGIDTDTDTDTDTDRRRGEITSIASMATINRPPRRPASLTPARKLEE